ncbi:TPA: hypothetical protein DDZ86_02590 [Candidatus Dependentiae bacterium]|nr:MAG: hypothetical protein UW09_C0001G0130 [candidate division TM6 bacterium GW2011_GWF2_43_87]HBL98507.1 hypothetical protein [Candidatus Dependentiae bacterium]
MALHQKTFPYRVKGRFLNNPGEEHIGFSDPIQMCVRALFQRNNGIEELKESWTTTCDLDSLSSPHRSPRIVWIGHSTFLIKMSDFTILTDPILGSPSKIFFPRLTSPGIEPEKLPRIDAVLISHNHPDHLDLPSLQLIQRKNPAVALFVPWGDKHWLTKKGFKNVSEYMWWDEIPLSLGSDVAPVELTFLPAQHLTRRGIFDRNTSLWGSWLIKQNDRTVYFAGDTAYANHFRVIANNTPPIETALMPISPCEPRNHMKKNHISAEDAGEAFLELGASRFIPMHWGTYHFGEDYPLTPIHRLQAWWDSQKSALANKQLELLKIGQLFTCNQITSITSITSIISEPTEIPAPILLEQKNERTQSL